MNGAERDYSAEMDALLAGATAGEGWLVGVVAAKLHAGLLESDPELLDGWLHENAVPILAQHLRDRERSIRSKARAASARRAFASAAADAEESGDFATMASMFAVSYPVNDENLRKRVADMTGEDHLFVAREVYQRQADENKLLAAFHRAVAKKVGNRTTSEVFTEEQYEAMYLSITAKAA